MNSEGVAGGWRSCWRLRARQGAACKAEILARLDPHTVIACEACEDYVAEACGIEDPGGPAPV